MTLQNASACSSCGEPALSTLACLACGAVEDERGEADHFARLGLPRSPSLDAALLERRYLQLARRLHPDFHGGGAPDLVARVNRHAALLNEARETLGDDDARREYLLELLRPGALERHKQLAPAFLMEALELSEQAEGAADAALRARLDAEIDARRATLADAALWTDPDAARLATLLHELRVFRRIRRDALASDARTKHP